LFPLLTVTKGIVFNHSLSVAGIVAGSLVFIYILIFKILGHRVIRSDEVAVVEKWWSLKGSPEKKEVEVNLEAGNESNTPAENTK